MANVEVDETKRHSQIQQQKFSERHNRREFLEDRFNGNIHDINAYNRQRDRGFPAYGGTAQVVNKGFGAMNFDNGGKYSHILKEDGTYIEPKDFLDEFHIHMHQNRQMALQGMTKEEVEIAEQCIQKFEAESVRKPQISRNAYEKPGSLSIALNDPQHVDPSLLYEDVHNYEAIQC